MDNKDDNFYINRSNTSNYYNNNTSIIVHNKINRPKYRSHNNINTILGIATYIKTKTGRNGFHNPGQILINEGSKIEFCKIQVDMAEQVDLDRRSNGDSDAVKQVDLYTSSTIDSDGILRAHPQSTPNKRNKNRVSGYRIKNYINEDDDDINKPSSIKVMILHAILTLERMSQSLIILYNI